MTYRDLFLDIRNSLRAAGKRVILLSNAQRLFTIAEMEMTGICKYFDDIFISSDHGVKKPQKEFMEKLLEKHSIKESEALMIGNEIRTDCLCASLCGVPSAFVNTGGLSDEEIEKEIQRYLPEGYRPLILPDGRLLDLLRIQGGNDHA